MKLSTTLSIFAIFFGTHCLAEEPIRAEKFFINASVLTSQYHFKLNDTLDEVPDNFRALLPGLENTKDDDVLNTSFGLGYYFSDELSLRVNYVDDIGLFNVNIGTIFGGFLATNEFEGEMSILEVDTKYNFVQINKQVSLFAVVGAAYHQLDARVVDSGISDADAQILIQQDITSWESKFGIGVQYDFLHNMGLNFGYTRYSFASIDKTYIEFEYRF